MHPARRIFAARPAAVQANFPAVPLHLHHWPCRSDPNMSESEFPDPLRRAARRLSEEEQLLADTAARAGKPYVPRAKTFRSVVTQWTAKRNIAAVQESELVQEAWSAAVDDLLRPHTRAGKITRGVLHVWVDSPLVVQELTLQKPRLLKAMIERLPDHRIKSWKLHVR